MSETFILLPVALQRKKTLMELRESNEASRSFGLQLTEPEMLALVENRKEALERNGRVEFGGGVIRKIILEFMDSPYLNQDVYAETLVELQECFYYFKHEALELLSDDELIQLMKLYYDEICHGSVEFLQSSMLENHCRDIRYQTEEYRDICGYEDEYSDFLDWDEKEW